MDFPNFWSYVRCVTFNTRLFEKPLLYTLINLPFSVIAFQLEKKIFSSPQIKTFVLHFREKHKKILETFLEKLIETFLDIAGYKSDAA